MEHETESLCLWDRRVEDEVMVLLFMVNLCRYATSSPPKQY